VISLPVLNLPPFEPQLKREEDRVLIFDSLRRKFLALTPEEWVRQHWINFLVEHQSFPKGLISLEKGLKYNQLQKRTDLVVFDREGKPYLLIECKAPEIELNQKVLQQALAYRSTLMTPYIILSNGVKHISLEFEKNQEKFIQTPNFPPIP
jgi:type I site-specific restriction endonuclease